MNKLITIIILSISFLEIHAQVPAGYYDNASGLSGDQLKVELHSIIKGHTTLTYNEVKDALRATDEDPTNNNNVILIYTGRSMDKFDFASDPSNPDHDDFWNREHIWSKSHGFPDDTDTAYTDVHHLRPCDQTVNSSRSNKDFGELPHTTEFEEGEAPDTFTDSDFWEPRDAVKGDVARMMFYMATRYESNILDLELTDHITFSGQLLFGKLYKLIKWHENDPVDQFEIDRNNEIYTNWQGNRNPFVDHPEYVQEIWGSTSQPLIMIDTLNFNSNFGQVAAGDNQVQSYQVNGYNLEDDVNIATTSPFEISLDGSTWSNSATLVSDNSSEEQIYTLQIRFAPDTPDGSTFDVVITHSSLNVADVSFNLKGEEGETLLTIAEARLKPLGETVTITGVVIDAGNNSTNNRVVYDGTAGIVVRSFDTGNESANLIMGDSVKVRGGLSEFAELLQIEESPISITVLKSNSVIPTAAPLTLDEVDEPYESQLVTISDVWFTESGTFQGGGSEGNYTLTDGTDNLVFRLGSSSHPLVGTDIPEEIISVTGIIGQFNADYQISPRALSDIATLQPMTISEARELPLGSSVLVSGVVIDAQNNSEDNRTIFDGTAGIEIRGLESGNQTASLVQGDSVSIYGRINEYQGHLQISQEPIKIEVLGQNKGMPSPMLVNLANINEAHESTLITTNQVFIEQTGSFESGIRYSLSSSMGQGFLELGLSAHPLVTTAIPTDSVMITGIVKESNGDYIISPRYAEDILVSNTVTSINKPFNNEVAIFPNPVKRRLNFTDSNHFKNVTLYTIQGEKILSMPVINNSVDLSKLNKGCYLLLIEETGQHFKLLKE